MEKIKRIPRKIKKELKRQINVSTCCIWKSNEIRIHKVERHSRYKGRNPSYKGLTVMSHSLIKPSSILTYGQHNYTKPE